MIKIQDIKVSLKIIACCLGLACNTASEKENAPIIPLQENVSMEIDGEISDWNGLKQTFLVENFVAPWHQGDHGKTLFKSISDGEWVYFYFEAEDLSPVVVPFAQEDDVAQGDRVEFFVSGDPELGTYYCAELAPDGNVLDYEAKYYRKFDSSWNLKNLEVKTKSIKNGYRVEGKLPVSFFKALDPEAKDNSCTIWLGLYRADFISLEEGKDQVNWMTWINPEVEEPDFHIPSSFQKIMLMY